jgi:hypothetical protein
VGCGLYLELVERHTPGHEQLHTTSPFFRQDDHTARSTSPLSLAPTLHDVSEEQRRESTPRRYKGQMLSPDLNAIGCHQSSLPLGRLKRDQESVFERHGEDCSSATRRAPLRTLALWLAGQVCQAIESCDRDAGHPGVNRMWRLVPKKEVSCIRGTEL